MDVVQDFLLFVLLVGFLCALLIKPYRLYRLKGKPINPAKLHKQNLQNDIHWQEINRMLENINESDK